MLCEPNAINIRDVIVLGVHRCQLQLAFRLAHVHRVMHIAIAFARFY